MWTLVSRWALCKFTCIIASWSAGTGKVQDKHTGKTFAQTTKEHCCGSYNPTIKYQALRRCAVPRYAYYDDSATDCSSDSEIETETMEAEEAQYHKDKIPDPTKDQKIFRYDPNINYEVVKQFAYLDSPDPPDSFIYYSTDSERETMEAQTRRDIYRIASREDLIFLDPNFKYGLSDSSVISGTETGTQVETETMAEEETSTHEDKILAGTEDEQLFHYDPRIKYEPLKRYVVPRFAFCDTSSTDWSDSTDSSAFSDSEPQTETKIMAAEEAQAQKDKILSGT